MSSSNPFENTHVTESAFFMPTLFKGYKTVLEILLMASKADPVSFVLTWRESGDDSPWQSMDAQLIEKIPNGIISVALTNRDSLNPHHVGTGHINPDAILVKIHGIQKFTLSIKPEGKLSNAIDLARSACRKSKVIQERPKNEDVGSINNESVSASLRTNSRGSLFLHVNNSAFNHKSFDCEIRNNKTGPALVIGTRGQDPSKIYLIGHGELKGSNLIVKLKDCEPFSIEVNLENNQIKELVYLTNDFLLSQEHQPKEASTPISTRINRNRFAEPTLTQIRMPQPERIYKSTPEIEDGFTEEDLARLRNPNIDRIYASMRG